jgi:hypothetical protein
MYFLSLALNFFALGALFSNHRLAATASFLAYTALNLLLLFLGDPTSIDATFFVIQVLAVLVVYALVTSSSRDQVLTHQKKRASPMLLVWSMVLAVFFGHWFLGLYQAFPVPPDSVVRSGELPHGETFLLIAVVILWMVGKNLYDRR